MTKKNTWILVSIIFVMIFYFWWRGVLFLDPDFGWHIRMGQLIGMSGIPVTDPFSYTMAHYPFVDHEWLTNISLSKTLPIIGYAGLALLFAVIAVAAYALQVFNVSEKARRFAWPFLLLALLSVTGMIGIRPQLLTWLLFSLVLIVVRDVKRFERYRLLLPLLFLLWVNVHGGFAIGIAALVIATIYYWYKKPEQRFITISVFAASVVATCVTPYGFRSWWEVWMQMTDGKLRWTIAEWTPAIFIPDLLLWLFIIFSLMFVGRYLRKYSLLDLSLYFGLLIAGLSSIRHAPLWLLIAMPITIEAVVFFYQDITKIKFATKRFSIMAKVFVAIILLFAILDLRSVFYALGFFGKQSTYPEKAVHYLNSHQSTGQIFSFYDWGGYLIWKNPSKKVFIDGRMPSWRWNANVPGESNYAFADYQKILDGKIPFTTLSNKYKVDTLLLPIPSGQHKSKFETMIEDLGTKLLHWPVRNEVGFGKVIGEAKKAGWKVVYKDDTAVIYRSK